MEIESELPTYEVLDDNFDGLEVSSIKIFKISVLYSIIYLQ